MTERVAIVTGGSSGIGREAATRLGQDGYAVVIGYGGNQVAAEETVKEVEQAGGRAIAVRADVADETAVAALFDRAEQEFGGIDVVVNAAGIMPLAPLADLDLDVFDRVVRTNLRGTFVVDQQAVRRVRGGGAIVNVSSSLTKLARPGYSAYSATKGGVEAVTLILARELRGRDITVNTVAPGPTATARSSRASRRSWSTGSPPSRRWSASGSRPTSPRSSHSWPVRPAGSTVRSSTPTAARPPDPLVLKGKPP
ncbi:SDR family NAD(P)-dependent oxidoreductase [Kribbella sp. CCNWLW197]